MNLKQKLRIGIATGILALTLGCATTPRVERINDELNEAPQTAYNLLRARRSLGDKVEILSLKYAESNLVYVKLTPEFGTLKSESGNEKSHKDPQLIIYDTTNGAEEIFRTKFDEEVYRSLIQNNDFIETN